MSAKRGIKLKFGFKSPPIEPDILLEKYGLEKGGPVQQAIDKAVIDWCVPYTPWRTGRLAMNPYISTTIGSGDIVYDVPYAQHVYYGEGKTVYSTEIHPLAGSFWFERMKADHLMDIVEAARAAMKGGSHGRSKQHR